MDFDLDDLLEDQPTGYKPSAKPTTAQRHTSAAVGKFGGGKKAGADLDDLGDSFNFDDVLGGGGSKAPAPHRSTTFGAGGANSGVGSTKAGAITSKKMDDDDSFFGVGRSGS